MNIMQIGIITFSTIETLNILMLYFSPGMKIGNALGVFKAWDKAQEDEQMKSFAHYMASWVAGAKLIFILVGISVVIWGNIETQLATCAAMVISIASFFWRLYPNIRKMDKEGQIDPKGYSKTLLGMIVAFILGFAIIFVIGLVDYLG
jgi:ABC-type methionine transport system permease subunit